MIGYHTNSHAEVRSFATNHFVYMDSEIKDVQWITEQYLTHTFHVAADNECAFTGEFIGLEGDEISFVSKGAIYRH